MFEWLTSLVHKAKGYQPRFWTDRGRYLFEAKYVPPEEPIVASAQNETGKCVNCKIPLRHPEDFHCDVCQSILLSVSLPYFAALQTEWEQENHERASKKREIMGD